MASEYWMTTDGFRKGSTFDYKLHPVKEKRQIKCVERSKALDKYKSVNKTPQQKKSLIHERKINNSRPLSTCVYTVRSLSCTPPDMFLHENVREYARKPNTHQRRCKSADVAYKLNGQRISLPHPMSQNDVLTHKDLTMGQKQYIWGIARCYSVEQLKKANIRRTQGVLDYEFGKRMVTRDIADKTKIKLWKDYNDYSQVINEVSKKGFVRPKSSFSRRVLYGDDHMRPNTAPANHIERSRPASSHQINISLANNNSEESEASDETNVPSRNVAVQTTNYATVQDTKSDDHIRPKTAPADHINRSRPASSRRINEHSANDTSDGSEGHYEMSVPSRNVSVQTTNYDTVRDTKRINSTYRPKSAGYWMRKSSVASAISSVEDELVFDANEKLSILDGENSLEP